MHNYQKRRILQIPRQWFQIGQTMVRHQVRPTRRKGGRRIDKNQKKNGKKEKRGKNGNNVQWILKGKSVKKTKKPIYIYIYRKKREKKRKKINININTKGAKGIHNFGKRTVNLYK